VIAAVYYVGWTLAHPAWFFIFLACCGILAVLAVVTHLENRRDDRAAGLPETPRRGTRSHARGIRARRRLPAPCRRARAMTSRAGGISVFAAHRLPGAVTWVRQAITRRIRALANVPGRDGNRPPPTPPVDRAGQHHATGHATSPGDAGREHAPAGDFTRLATAAERDAAGLDGPLYSWQTGEFATFIEAGEA
jgi:hypothetical protein